MHRPVTLTLRLPLSRRPLVARGVAVAVTAAAGAVLAACSTQSPAQTQEPYLPADGIPASIGAVQARDLLVVAQSKGATGVLSGSIINTGAQPVSVTFLTVADSQGSATGGTTIQLAAGQQQRITGVQFPNLQASPGALTGIVLKTTAGLKNVDVPVLLPDGPYSSLTATAGPSTATSTSTAGAAAGGTTGAPTGAPTGATTGATTGAAAGGTTAPTGSTTATATTSSPGG